MNSLHVLLLLSAAVTVFGTYNQEKGNEDGQLLSRSKRLIVRNGYWPRGIIPYVFDDSVSSSDRRQYIEKVFHLYETLSCIRFEPWNKTYHVNLLNHKNRLIFVKTKQCISKIGNTGGSGQTISCCYWKTCLHELAHTLGVLHEHNSPLRSQYVRIEQDNIVSLGKNAFNIHNGGRHYNMYDWQSIMHYAVTAFTSNGKPTITFLDNDLKPFSKFSDKTRYYYLFMQINDAYKCADKCSINCENGGYKAIVKGECGCVCPEGLNQTDSCSSLKKKLGTSSATEMLNVILPEKIRSNEQYKNSFDFDCGDIINLNDTNNKVTIISPTIKGVKKDITCYWFMKSPRKTRIYLNFKSYNILSADELAVRAYLPGNHGVVHNGKKIIQSHKNFLSFSFSKVFDKDATSSSPTSYFKVEAYFKHDDEFCYNTTNGGKNYNGKVNFAKDLTPCLKWSEVTNCKHHAFNYRDADKNLVNNYCRNPDNSIEPWCYIKKDGCIRDFCDACNFGQCKNTESGCDQKIKNDPSICRKTTDCRKACSSCNQLPSILDVNCSTPILPPDADHNVTLKANYSVSEKVKVKCAHNTDYQQITCLSDGSWSPLNFVCGTCKPGWTSFANGCYKFFNDEMKQEAANNFCKGLCEGCTLLKEYQWSNAFVKDFLNNGGKTCKPVWMDLSYDVDGGVYTWGNGDLQTAVAYSNWAGGKEPSKYCVTINEKCEWKDVACRDKFKVMCQYPRTAAPCKDQIDNCKSLKNNISGFCDGKYKNSYARTNCARSCDRCDQF